MGCISSREDEESEFVIMLEKAKTTGGKYEDVQFPANKTSLIKDWNSGDPEIQGLVETWEKFEWIRVSEIASLNDDEGKLKVFAGKIEPNDIK